MALPAGRSRPLHNFTLPTLCWANQRYLRCKKIDDTQQPNSSNPGSETPSAPPTSTKTHHRFSVPESPVSSNDGEGIEAVCKKVMSDPRFAADRMKFPMLEENEKQQQQLMAVLAGVNANRNETNSNSNSASARPCNLRTRRAVCKKPSPPAMVDSPRRANSKRAKFSISLTREEIESDFLMITGKKPPRRPKKRNRNVQKQVDCCLPGLCLSEVTADTYKVPDRPDSGKPRYGLVASIGTSTVFAALLCVEHLNS